MTLLPTTTNEFEQTFVKSFSALEGIFAFIDTFIEANQLGDSTSYTIRFAIEEIFTNMVKYNPLKHDVTIRCARHDETISITLIDVEAKPFDITARPDVDLTTPLEQRRPGGLGIFLVKKMLDNVAYAHDGTRSTITLTHHLNHDNL